MGLGFTVWVLSLRFGFRVYGLGLGSRIWFRVWGLDLRFTVWVYVLGFEFRVYSLGLGSRI